MRLRKKPWANEELQNNDFVISKEKKNLQILIDKLEEFDEFRIEIGCGKGQFIKKHADVESNILFLAVEKYEDVLCVASRNSQDKKGENLYFYHGDIIEFLEYKEFLNKVQQIYLNFSDPWPKTRHEKRRLTYKNFLDLYYSLLKKDGIIELKTDNTRFYEYSIKSIANFKKYMIDEVLIDLHSTEHDSINYQTEYEQKFIKKGQNIKFISFKK